MFQVLFSRLRLLSVDPYRIHKGKVLPTLLSSVLSTLLIVGVQEIGGFQWLELSLFNQLMSLRSDQKTDSRLLIVTLTETDIKTYKQWPIKDELLAQVLQTLQQHQPRVIGIDLFRDIPYPPGYEKLKKQLQNDNVITITKIPDSDNLGGNSPPNVSLERVGFNDILIDIDGVIRRNLLIASYHGKGQTSFAWKVVERYLKAENISPQQSSVNPLKIQWGKAELIPLDSRDGGYQNVDTQGYQILLNYRNRDQLARQLTLNEVLNGEFDPAWIRDKIVLIGTTASSSRDIFFTPYSFQQADQVKMPGVLIHGQMISQLLTAILEGNNLLLFWPNWAEFAWISLWALWGGIVAICFSHPLLLSLIGGGSLLSLFGLGFFLFTSHIWIILAAPASAFLLTGTFVITYRQVYNACHDPLTDLPNRSLFINRVRQSLSRRQYSPHPHIAILFLDIDRFKVINDSLGHEIGDTAIINLVERLKTTVNFYHNNMARVGGDNFAILLENIENTTEAITFAQKIHQALLVPFYLGGREIFLTLSIGIAITEVGEELPEILIRNAHTAMYRAKELGRGRHQVFNTAMHLSAVELLQLQTDLRAAIKQGEFELHYQPFISLNTGKIIGFEALIRWNHPQRGWVSPVKFIPIAEDTGLIIPLGQWVIEEACRQLHDWQKQFPHYPPLIMSVNLSGKQFSQPDLVEKLTTILQESQILPHTLKVEITESVVMDDVESAIAVLKEIKSLNIKLGIDDFGTGYSSLSYLSRFPTDTLKVDKSFVGRMELAGEGENVAIVRTIITLAHVLGMDVIAEGVETVEQLAKLRFLGCEYGQGFFFSKPLPRHAMEDLLTSDPQWKVDS